MSTSMYPPPDKTPRCGDQQRLDVANALSKAYSDGFLKKHEWEERTKKAADATEVVQLRGLFNGITHYTPAITFTELQVQALRRTARDRVYRQLESDEPSSPRSVAGFLILLVMSLLAVVTLLVLDYQTVAVYLALGISVIATASVFFSWIRFYTWADKISELFQGYVDRVGDGP